MIRRHRDPALLLCLCVAFGTRVVSAQTSTAASPAQQESASDSTVWQAKKLAQLRARLVGHEDEPAETVFENIELLRGKPASRLPGMMEALTGLLGVTCTTCHVPDRWESDEKEAKLTARRHFSMQAALNEEYFGGANAITCWTCHRGSLNPPAQ